MVGIPATVDVLPPSDRAPTAETVAALMQACRANNIDIVGAPLAMAYGRIRRGLTCIGPPCSIAPFPQPPKPG